MERHLGKFPEYILEIYQKDKNNWYKKDKEGILPKYLQRQQTRDTSKIHSQETLSNFKTYLTGIRPTGFKNVYTGDSGRLLTNKSLIIFVFSDCQTLLLAFIFRGYYKRFPNQITAFAELFFDTYSEQIRECINNTPPLGS